jgi:hypothetical protein
MKIYDHIQCIGIIQNLILFIIMQGRYSIAENHCNDSPIVITIQYISQKKFKLSVRRNEPKVNSASLCNASESVITIQYTYSKIFKVFVSRNKLKLTECIVM